MIDYIWLIITLAGAIYAMYVIDKFADDVNPYNWTNRRDNDK